MTESREKRGDVIGALAECQKTLATLIDPNGRGSGINTMTAFANCVAAESRARAALARARGEQEGG